MVERLRISGIVKLFVIILVALMVVACNVDLFGFFAANEQDDRLESRDIFNFLGPSDQGRDLGAAYSFVVVSDTHIEDGNAHGLEKLAYAVSAAGDKFVVVTGDITQNGKREDLNKFISIAEELRKAGIPCYPVIGNHDIYFDNWPVWKELIGSTSYRIDHSNTTLFILDSANASFGSDQLDWLQQGLGSAKEHVFVFTHTNLFTESPGDIMQITDSRERARIVSILKGRCDVMFMGHVHHRIIREVGGVRYINLEDYVGYRTYCRVYVGPGGISWAFEKL
ncbi:Ser/Thr protein phosphatase family protein [Treponema primitia ZAS-2]|uniref:Ser/Thr protein phosphatase family protein n=1 Tax=Treponema primitia (strain ATCC BAA-887 / DSM 12427 / ZAS-2) TaxID=545694 RepID=F5YPY2_TREPZ|nr:metallophosphoesterase [Treponema primitia]AEF87039.1 Ser/Thr protein phosphatase family protein [Treponema primitia ZAS-2]